jgi:hypothetical protein
MFAMKEQSLLRARYAGPVRGCFLAGLLLFAAGAANPATAVPRSEAERTLASLPAWFEANTGQYAPAVKYFSRHGAGSLFVGAKGATFRTRGKSLDIAFAGAGPLGPVEGVEPAASRGSYFIGNDPLQWKRGIQHYAKVRARQIYPGIDVVYYLAGEKLEFDLVVAPGADAGRIRLAFKGAGAARLDAGGNLTFAGGLRQDRPVAYQETPSGRVAVDARYVVARNNEVRLDVASYDSTRPLVIDPVLHAGYLGGDQSEIAKAIAVDRQGNVWITGSSASTIALPAQNAPFQEKPNGQKDVFLAKLTPDAAGRLTLAYWTQLGGAGDDEAQAIALDNAGFVYLAGSTASADFPRRGATLQTDFGGGTDAFVAMIRPADSGLEALWYSQFYGGSETDAATSVAVDSAGAIYFAGYTTGGKLTLAAAPATQAAGQGGYEGFMVKVLPASSTPLAFATYFGGGSTDVITAITAGAAGEVYLAGYTASDNFPITDDAFQKQKWSGVDAFLVKLDLKRPGLDSLVYGTFVGGEDLDVAQAIKLDDAGGLWLAGYTFSRNFPVSPDAYRTVAAGGADVFLTRFDLSKLASANAIAYSTYLGGAGTDVLYGMTLASGGRVALAGYTFSSDFPQAGGAPVTVSGPKAFVSLLDPAKPGDGALAYSALFGGALIDAATGVAADATGRLFVSGFTTSTDFPVTDGSTKLSPGGAAQSFIVQVAPDR